jgi:excisionase family DNA binding protein
MKQFLNASEVAKLLGVDRATVIRWIKKGAISGVVRPPGSQQWKIPLSAYERMSKPKT